MMYIVVKRGGITMNGEWHVGTRLNFSADTIAEVIEVQADGDELAHVKRTMDVPTTTSAVNRWFGETARFIAGNL